MTAAAGPGRGRSPGADIESGRFVRNNALTTASTLFAGVLGFAVQAVTGHNLHPGQFGKAAAVLTFFAILTRGSASFGRLVAWQTSRDLSEPDTLASGALRQVTLWLFALGIAAAAVSIAAGTILAACRVSSGSSPGAS
jgi:O-antigen/teichoic acid export membrane protein